MGQSTLSRELALRIGLAARALPDTPPKRLVLVLTELLGLPLTHAKLESLTFENYRNVLDSTASPELIKKSLAILQGIQDSTSNHLSTPQIQFYRRGDMPHSIRIAVASSDGVHVDGPFNSCKQFYIFQVSADESRLIAIRAAETADPLSAEQKQHYRAEIVQDCQVLYSSSLGAPAAAKVIKHGVHPIKLNVTAVIADIVEQLQHVLQTSPPPWLAKTMGVSSHSLKSPQQEKVS
ncbi:MAG: dinitrogenase iron-molybdenum cofactor biosynthesis protein [Gammaproteobacteria bacterium]